MREKLERLFNDRGRRWRSAITEAPPARRRVLVASDRFGFVAVRSDEPGVFVVDDTNSFVMLAAIDAPRMDKKWSYIRKDAGRAA